MQKIKKKYISSLIRHALREDLGSSGDITSRNIKNRRIEAKIIAGENCIVGGLIIAKEIFKFLDKRVFFKAKTIDGKKIKKGKVIAVLKGDSLSILKGERVALNFLGLISGVATTTSKFVKKVKGRSCKICCTRKTLPNLRLIQKYAVRLGGGTNHRFNLSDEILIKDNHISIHKNIRNLVLKTIKNKKGKKITVEVDNLSQFKKIIGLKFNRVLFDNMKPKNLRTAIKMSKKLYETEASGGVTLSNIRKIASTGVKRISIGQITHSSPAIDFKLDVIS